MFWFIIFSDIFIYKNLTNDLSRSDKPHKLEIFKTTKAFTQKITKKHNKFEKIVQYNIYRV